MTHPDLTDEPDAWRLAAACRDADAEMFYPAIEQVGHPDVTGPIAYCRRCPVQRECLITALRLGEPHQHGIWAGTTARQRRRWLRKTARG